MNCNSCVLVTSRVVALAAIIVGVIATDALHADHIQTNEQQSYWRSQGKSSGILEQVFGSNPAGNTQNQNRPASTMPPGYTLGGNIARKIGREDQQKLIELTTQVLRDGGERSWLNAASGVLVIARNDEQWSGSGRPASTTNTTSNSGAPAGTPQNPSWDPGGVFGDIQPGRANLERLTQTPPIERIDAKYRAKQRLRIRGGPGRNYEATHTVDDGEVIHVVGRVSDSEWVMVSHEGRGLGFVFGRLLEPAPIQNVSLNVSAPRERVANNQNNSGSASGCRRIIQEAVLRDGSRAINNPVFCRTADGHWEMN